MTCDCCGHDNDHNGALQGIRLVPVGDLLLCPACLLGLGEDNRPMCSRCNMLVPMGFIGLMPCDENIFIVGCPCGYLWDERVEGRTAVIWKAMGVQP